MKKLLSIVLITAMVLALVPSAFATTTETDTSNLVRAYNFDFGAAGYAGIDGQTGETEIAHATLQQYGDTYATDGETSTRTGVAPTTWATTNTDPWVVDAHSYATIALTSGATDEKKADALYWSMAGVRTYQNSAAKTNGCIVIRLEIDKPGTYFPRLNFFARNDLGIYDVCILPVTSTYFTNSYSETPYLPGEGVENTGTKKLTSAFGYVYNKSDYYLGKIDMYTASNAPISTELTENDETNSNSLNSFTLNQNDIDNSTEYYLMFRTNGINSSATLNSNGKQALTQYVNLFSFELYQEETEYEFTPSTDNSYTEAPETATVSRLALYGDASETIETETVTYGNSTTINEVPATVTKDGKTYNFLYWAKGLEEGVSKQILSTSNAAFPYKPHAGNNFLIAVYEEKDAAKEAFYNKNGQLLTDLGIKDDKLPALPAMAGRGDAIKWVQRGTNLEFDGGADVSNLEGDKVFMAKYDEVENNITINGRSYSYGDDVSCKDIVDSTENFSYWTRQIGDGDAEIISLDENYSFSAYTDCTIAAVCNGAVTLTPPRKIALSTFSVGDKLTAVMAEFIGFGDAKEKGIMFGGKKIAMTTDKAQFTVTNDTTSNVEVTGYAIVGDDQYVDGEITVDAAK